MNKNIQNGPVFIYTFPVLLKVKAAEHHGSILKLNVWAKAENSMRKKPSTLPHSTNMEIAKHYMNINGLK